jgi:hypothetical protein
MNKSLLALAVATAVLGSAVAGAETLVVDDKVMVRESNVQRPARGMAMGAVEKQFGEPQDRHAAVGKPPITRWDYAGFAVFFEGERVIDAVALGS